jgi:cell cycle checkpoint protein
MDSLFSRKKPSQKMVTPIVMIISETLLSTSTASADSFTAYRLLGPEILTHVGVSVIEFNPVAPTYLTKALELVIQKESRRTGRRRAPGPSVLKHLANTGDIRSAMSSLEFLCLRGDEHDDWSGKVTFSKTKRGSDAPLSKMEMESLETITQRESTLGIFHAVGKVVYNKRELSPATSTPPPQPPTHLPQHARPRASDVSVEFLLNELGTDIQTFVAALHENYVLSCEGIDSEDTLDHVNGCIDSLSDSDILSPDRFSSDRNRAAFQGSGTDNLRQDEISFQISVRGLLFSLPHPVKRTIPPPNLSSTKVKGLARGPAYQMFYPNSLRIWRQRDEIDQLLELFINKLRDGEIYGTVQTSSSKSAKLNGVETWRLNRYSGVPTPSTTSTTTSNEGDEFDSSATLLAGGSSAKTEILLEKLPYMTLIEMRKGTFGSTTLRRELEKITKVTGTVNLNGNEEEDLAAETEPAEQWSTDKPADEGKATPIKTRVGLLKGSNQAHIIKSRMDSLVLEDDDIEDD